MVKFLFRNNNFTLDFIFTVTEENKFLKKFDLQKGEYDPQRG